MQTIVEPKQHIDELWGKQRVREDKTYRLMKYLIRVFHEGKVLFHNVVTGQLVVLETDEAKVVSELPTLYTPVMKQLVTEHYLVPEDYDEHQQVMNLRTILRKLDYTQQDAHIVSYSILPTTACNARCYYCYEHGVEPMTMTEQIADEVVEFIRRNSGNNRKVGIQWFGGEPTIASARIDQICNGLRKNGIDFVSTMITNGYLFDEEMVARAKKCWNLAGLQISIDGTEQQCNEIKAFSVKSSSPYRRIIRNVGLLIQNDIQVGLRMNFDLGNEDEFGQLLTEIKNLYGKSKYLSVRAYPVVGEYARPDGAIRHGSDAWLDETLLRLNDQARRAGLRLPKKSLPSLRYRGCAAQRDSFVAIMPNGDLVKCVEQLGPEQKVGDLQTGVVNEPLIESWKLLADYDKCKDCSYYPECIKTMNCSGKDRCLNRDRHYEFETAMKRAYDFKKGDA